MVFDSTTLQRGLRQTFGVQVFQMWATEKAEAFEVDYSSRVNLERFSRQSLSA